METTEQAYKLWYLRRCPLFDAVHGEELRLLAAESRIMDYHRGERLMAPGGVGEEVFLVKTGRVKVSKVGGDGKVMTLLFLGEGDVFGALASEDMNPDLSMEHGSVIEAHEDCCVLMMNREHLAALQKKHPDMNYRIWKLVGVRFARICSRLEQLYFKDVPARLSATLLGLADEYGTETPAGIRIDLRLTHSDLAQLVGCARETVSALVSALRTQNVVDADGRRLVIRDRDKLAALDR